MFEERESMVGRSVGGNDEGASADTVRPENVLEFPADVGLKFIIMQSAADTDSHPSASGGNLPGGVWHRRRIPERSVAPSPCWRITHRPTRSSPHHKERARRGRAGHELAPARHEI